MVYPPIPNELTSRSSLEQSTQSLLCQSQSSNPSSLLPHHQHHHHHHHHQQQHQQQQPQQQQTIIYTPYSTIPACIPPTNQPQCIYPNARRNITNTVTLRNQDSFRNVKNTKWKSRPIRVKEFQSNLQHSLSYAPPQPQPPPPPPPPLVLFDPMQSHLSASPATTITPIYLNQSSTLYNHGGIYSNNENFTNYNTNVITPSYYKPPEVQTYCLIDRPSTQTRFPHQQAISPASNYYNATTNTKINHQNITSYLASTSNIYPSNINNDSRIAAVGPNQIISNSLINHGININNYTNDKHITKSSTTITNELLMGKCSEKIFNNSNDRTISNSNQLFTLNIDIDNDNLSGSDNNNIGIVKRECDERFSDESSNFDFTIEAEKMVSALCNTTSCELNKDDDVLIELNDINKKLIKNNDIDNNADDNSDDNNIDNRKKLYEYDDKTYDPWYFNDFLTEIKLTGESIGTQTTDTFTDKLQYPELIRKTIYWGCNEADRIIKNSQTTSPKENWLKNLSSATKIALTKSSTCFPIYSGDNILIQDLISALLRISNGWLILDHYLNKHHNPNINDKYETNFIELFKQWEVTTNNLLNNIIKTFIKLEINNCSNNDDITSNSTIINSSFPGDISLYVNYGLFGDPSAITIPITTPLTPQSQIKLKPLTTFTRKCLYINNDNCDDKNNWSMGKESRLRTKWTITEHTRGSNEMTKKNYDKKSNWNILPKDFSLNQIPQLINAIEPQQKLQCNFISLENNENSNKSKQLINVQQNSTLNMETIPIDKNREFWNSCITSSPLYNFTYNNTNLNNNFNNKTTMIRQIETQKSQSNDNNTINLSAWLTNIRNKRLSNTDNASPTWLTSTPSNAPIKLRESKSFNSLSRMDTNRQLRTLKNMRTIQCAPWTANHLINDHQDTKRNPDECDSSEDMRVYMKPGSYNVPRKKNQSRRSQKRDSLAHRNKRQNISNNDEISCPSNSLIVSRSNISSSSSSTSSQDNQKNKDATWKAACASAGLLLNELKARENLQINDNHKIVNSTSKHSEVSEDNWKNYEDDENNKRKINLQLTEDNSDSLKLSSLDTTIYSHDDHQKNNIKTDSWLIRTLNNVVTNEINTDNKHTQDNNNDIMDILPRKESIDDDKKLNEHSFSLETSHTISVMTLVDVAGKATYSETVRRYSSTTKPTPYTSTKIIQPRNDDEREKIDNNSLCTIDECTNEEQEELIKRDNIKSKSDKMIKLKKNKYTNDDRDWSVWYSSKRKHHNNNLCQVTLDKLINIHRTLWQIDITRILKFPMANNKTVITDNKSSVPPIVESLNMEHYRKIVKSPIFLETIGYKLKNHEYRKIEHAIRDFRRIINNSKLYYKNDKDNIEKIDNLSKKFEELVQHNFTDELSLIKKNYSPNQIIINSNNTTINNSSPSKTTIIYNGEHEIALNCRKSTRTS